MRLSERRLWIGFAVSSSVACFGLGWISGWCFRQLFIMAAPITPHVPMIAMIIGSVTVLVWIWKEMLSGFDYRTREKTPNDLKISDSEAGRGSCRGEGAKAAGKEQLP